MPRRPLLVSKATPLFSLPFILAETRQSLRCGVNGRLRSCGGLADKCWLSQTIKLGRVFRERSATLREKIEKEEEEGGRVPCLEGAARRSFERRWGLREVSIASCAGLPPSQKPAAGSTGHVFHARVRFTQDMCTGVFNKSVPCAQSWTSALSLQDNTRQHSCRAGVEPCKPSFAWLL